MAVSSETRKRFSLLMGLRAVLMLLGGLYALIFPAEALTILVIAGGILLLIDGVLGLWGLTFGGQKTGNYWFDVVRNALAIVMGVLILISPFLAAIVTAAFLVYVLAFQAIFVGVMEMVVVVRERGHYARIWPVLLSGALYVIFGILLLLAPFLGALFLVMLGGAMMVIFSFALFALAWKVRQS